MVGIVFLTPSHPQLMLPILKNVFDLLMPRPCAMCGNRLSSSEKHLCTTCLMALPLTNLHLQKENAVEKLFWEQFPIERAASLFYHDGIHTRGSIYRTKYDENPEVAYWMACAYAKELQQSDFLDDVDGIVPMPLHWRKQLKRHYNQSAYIAEGIHRITGIPVFNHVVTRKKNNPSQTTVSGNERKKNVEDVFLLQHPEQIRGMHLLLVDDVLTTGSTITSCAKELAKAEGVRISVLTLSLASLCAVPATDSARETEEPATLS